MVKSRDPELGGGARLQLELLLREDEYRTGHPGGAVRQLSRTDQVNGPLPVLCHVDGGGDGGEPDYADPGRVADIVHHDVIATIERVDAYLARRVPIPPEVERRRVVNGE